MSLPQAVRRWFHDLRGGHLRLGVITLLTDAKASRDVLTAFEVGRDFERRHALPAPTSYDLVAGGATPPAPPTPRRLHVV